MKKSLIITFLIFISLVACTNRDGEIIDLINSVKKQNDDLKAQITALKKTTDSALVAVLKVNTLQTATDKKIDLIQADLKALLAQIASLTMQMTATNTDLVTLKSKIDGLQVKCTELVAQIAMLNATNNNMNALLDSDGNSYSMVTIGTQTWMAENLKTTKFSNGENITYVDKSNEGAWYGISSYRVYDNNMQNKNKFGLLYNWNAISDVRNICPKGWRVPSELDWQILEIVLGLPIDEVRNSAGRGYAQNVGGKLKQKGIVYWNSPNTGATNETMFNAIAAGRYVQGYIQMYDIAGFWSTTSDSNDNVTWNRFLNYGDGAFWKAKPSGGEIGNQGLSCRCLKN